MKQNNSLGIYSGYCSFVTDGYEMDFNVLLLQGAEQAQSPEVVLRERTRQLSKNSVRVALPTLGLCSCLCNLHRQFSQLQVQSGFMCKFYMRFCSQNSARYKLQTNEYKPVQGELCWQPSKALCSFPNSCVQNHRVFCHAAHCPNRVRAGTCSQGH